MRASAILCVALLAQPAAAQWSGWDYDNDRPVEQFKDLEVKLPAYPRDDNLLPFETSAASRNKFYIDSKSLSVGEDGVVRYALVVRTSGGATNVSYEGMRCDTREVKIYATGQPDSTWTMARDPKWSRIQVKSVNIYHGVLFKDYFCALKTTATPAARVQQALDLLRTGPRDTIRD